jgi:hypothetical protein
MKIAFATAAVFLILAQIALIVAVQINGKQVLMDIYTTLGVELAPYVKFMFRVIAWWWILPLACALLSLWSFQDWSKARAMLVLLTNAACLFVLCWTSYSATMRLGHIHVVPG